MSDLFISYASQDREVIQKLVAALEAQGWNVWWDRHIDIGSNFDDRIEKAISETLCIVVVWSKHSIGSNWVRAEATEGLERNILVPILIDDVRPPLLFRQKQSISLVDWRHGTQEAGQLGDLIPSIASILASYSTSTLPVSTQRAWVVGRIESDPELEQLARAAYVALFLGLSYFENLFLYTSAFRGSSARSLGAEALSALVDEEGLDGFIHGALSSTPQGILFQLNVRSRDAAQTAPFTQISPVESLGLGVGQCLLSSAEALQGGRPADADRMLDFLGDRVTESLGFVWQSFQYADQNDYGRVKTACEAALQKDPGFSLLHQALATAYQYLGRWSDARETIARAIRSTHKESRQSVARARGMYFAMYSEDYARASEEFESLLKMSPLDESGINNLAVCRFYQLQFDQARELSTRDLSLYPMKKIGLQNAAFYSLYAGAFEEAD
ncbi:MAG: toll/interleukin-1 receptor domain-containing protein, partial [Pseudomonadales bacterium]